MKSKDISYNPIIFILFLTHFLLGCSEFDENKADPKATFTKIFDNDNFNVTYAPLDLRQTDDGGYLLFGTTGSFGISSKDDHPFLMKVDSEGKFLWEYQGTDAQVGTLDKLISTSSGGVMNYYYVCRDKFTAQALAYKVDHVQGNVTDQGLNLGDFAFPLAVAKTGKPGQEKIILQGYNSLENKTLIAKLNSGFQLQTDKPWEYSIEKEADSLVIRQVNGLVDPLPFMVGGFEDNPNFFYFNGFRNFKFSFNFIRASDGEYTGSIDGSALGDDVIGTVAHLSANSFSMSRLTNGSSFLFPVKNDVFFDAETSVGSTEFNKDALAFPELVNRGHIAVKKITVGGQDFIMYAVDTQSGQLALMVFDSAGQLQGTTYLGRGNKVTTGNFTLTEDNGLAVLGTVYVADRFPRFILFKFSEEELRKIIGL